MVSPAELKMRAVYTPDILGITVFADICFLIRGFSGIISAFTLRFNLKIHILTSCFYMAKCYLRRAVT